MHSALTLALATAATALVAKAAADIWTDHNRQIQRRARRPSKLVCIVACYSVRLTKRVAGHARSRARTSDMWACE